ncbi:MAG TPA: DUF3488 and transglutaminase-like domain-containing protein [Fluviicoccus sp.]|nr:DUF3488 and transglutaminase-like domain-containing protein [Fluviicoccus sp.]
MQHRNRYGLLVALAVSLAPHLTRLPAWLLLILLLAGLWRSPRGEARLPLPGKPLLLMVMLAGIAGIRTTYHTWFGPEAGVAFLIFCLALKLLEYRNERDYYLLIVLSLFVLATAFLFEQGLLESLYCVFAITVTVMMLAVGNLRDIPARIAIRKALVMMAQALPLMLVLFVFFPRLPPLWSMKLTNATGRTGMSDVMSPGDLASLGRSNELAFRVEFPFRPFPAKQDLYWRGLTFSSFDGVSWRPSTNTRLSQNLQTVWGKTHPPAWMLNQIRVRDLNVMSYKVILEPTDHNWLYALNLSLGDSMNVGLARDYTLVTRDPVYQRETYELEKYQVVSLDKDLPEWIRLENLALPPEGNPVARQMARSWRARYPVDTDYISAITRWFRISPFQYTLEPPPLGRNRVDEFLFKTKRGFCEHYASSFTYLLRAAGIPARVVVGYQGGEPSPTGDSWEVRQMDAHAWAEAWIEGRGWVQFDPTAAVAPDRIELGMSAMADDREVWGNSAISAVQYSNYQMLGELRSLMDYVNYRWQRDVVGYDSRNQEDFLLRLLGDNSVWRQLGVMFGSMALIGALLASMTLIRRRKPVHPADAVVLRLSAKWVGKGLQRGPGEGVLAYLARLEEVQPHWQAHAREFAEVYAKLRYAPGTGKESVQVRRLAQLLRAWPAYRPQKTQLVESSLAESRDSP